MTAPDDSAALFDRAQAEFRGGRFAQSLALFESLAARHPDVAQVHASAAAALVQLGRFAEAVQGFDRALALNPRDAQTHFGKATALDGLQRLEDALTSYDRAVMLQPGMVPALANRAQTLSELMRLDQAQASLDLALARSDLADLQFNKAILNLLQGRFAQGWPLYEARRHRAAAPVIMPALASPVWRGEGLAGKTLLLHAEQGLGDTIQFSRYARLAVAQGAKVILSVPAVMIRLLESLGDHIALVDEAAPPPPCDYHAMLLSMPLAFGTGADNIPAPIPYLRAEDERVKLWAARIGGQGFKIGIAWQGDPHSFSDRGRSIPLTCFSGLAKMRGVRLISLQKGAGVEQLENPPDGMVVERPGGDFDVPPHAFVDSAAAMQSLDLVITSDTAIAHLAGALGRPVWVALKQLPEWRWQLERGDSPWYPGMRLFRQQARGDWASAFTAMQTRLAEQIAQA